MSNGYGRSNQGFGIGRDESVNLIVKTALEHGVEDPRQIAYMLATAQHETRNFNAPDEDFGRQQARKLGYRGGEEYYGRGYVHLTHVDNYRKFDELLGLNGDLVKNPDLAKDPEIAAQILVLGMRDGHFTGKALDRYIDHDSHDLYNARRVVNGVNPKQPWSIKAAKECQDFAEQWEQKMPNLLKRVQQGDISQPGARTVADGGYASVLQTGDRGERLTQLQQNLNILGHTGANDKPLAVDGKFGPHTEHAVKAFQQAHGLDVDGKVGPQTRQALDQTVQQHQEQHKPQQPAQATQENQPAWKQWIPPAAMHLYDKIREALPGLQPEQHAQVTAYSCKCCANEGVGVEQVASVRPVQFNGKDLLAMHTANQSQMVTADVNKALAQPLEQLQTTQQSHHQQLHQQQASMTM